MLRVPHTGDLYLHMQLQTVLQEKGQPPLTDPNINFHTSVQKLCGFQPIVD